jgi:hypothetical protein
MSEYISTADPINVPFSDDSEEVSDDQLILDENDPTASPSERVTRAKKKSERVARLLAEGRQSKEEAAALRAEMAELKANQARLEGYVSAQRQPAQQQGDPYQARLSAIRARQAEAHRALMAERAAGTYTDARDAHYTAIAAEIEDEKATVIAERTMARMEPAARQQQAQQVWAHKYPEVYNNPKAFRYAQATFARRDAAGEKIDTEQIDEIMQETMTALRLGGKGKPTATEKARLSGQSSGGSSGGGAAAGVPMTRDLRRMATALYSDLSEEDAVKKWANTVGKTLRKDKVL